MSDADLEQIRQGRLAQLQSQGRGEAGGDGENGGQDESRIQKEREMRNSILAQILQPEAADRLGRIRMVNESRASDVENRLIMLAKTGQLKAKVDEDQLKDLLSAIADNEEKHGAKGSGRVVINRRKADWEDEDDLLDL